MRKALIKDRCRKCGNFWELEVDEEGMEAWREGLATIKQAFPNLSKDERRVLRTGTCLACLTKRREARVKK